MSPLVPTARVVEGGSAVVAAVVVVAVEDCLGPGARSWIAIYGDPSMMLFGRGGCKQEKQNVEKEKHAQKEKSHLIWPKTFEMFSKFNH